MEIHEKGRNEGNQEDTRKGFKKDILITSEYNIHMDIDGNRSVTCQTDIQYVTLMLYHNVKNSDEDRKIDDSRTGKKRITAIRFSKKCNR